MTEKSKRSVLDPRENFSKMKSVHQIGSIFFIAGLIYIIFSIWISKSIIESVPKLRDTDVPFTGSEAWRDLTALNNIGPKVAGTKENEVIAVSYIKTRIEKILQKMHKAQSAELDHQIVSGSYYLGSKQFSQATVYRSVQNLAVRLYGESQTRNALLLNCHFDSVYGSPGANDDIANCAIMLEILSILTSADTPTRHDIIFLFNGAEEVGLRASHGFITQHKWAKDIKVLINLEAAGSGGKEMLFQTGPGNSWLLLNHYHAVRRPFAQVSSEEVFQLNLIPSDTDFRIFRDYGNVIGLDFAHISKGYRYHTKYDDVKYLTQSFVQRTGENILALTLSLSNGLELDDVGNFSKDEYAVYFDYLGIVFVHYTKEIGVILNFVVSTLAIAIPFLSLIKATASSHTKHILKETFLGGLAIALGTGSSILLCYLMGYYLDKAGHAMSWYRNTELALGIYGTATLFAMIFANDMLDATLSNENSPLSLGLRVQARLVGVSVWWAILTIGITVLGYRSGYLFMIILFVQFLINLVIYFFNLQNSIRSWLYVHVFGQIFAMLWASYFFCVLSDVFIPITGRSGSSNNPEKIISILVCIGTIFISSYLIPLTLLLKGKTLQYLTVISIFLVSFFVATSTNAGFPYQDDSTGNPTPQRHHVMHTLRTLRDINGNIRLEDSGYLFLEWDRNSLKTIEGLTMPEGQPQTRSQMCNNEVLCAVPYVQSRMLTLGIQWLPTDSKPKIRNNAVIDSIEKFKIGDDLIKFVFTVNSTSLSSVYIRIRDENDKMQSWSFSETFVSVSNNTYFCSIANGLQDVIKPLKFDITVKSKRSENIIDITLVTLENDQENFSNHFRKLLTRFPSWTFPVPLVSSVNAYIY